MPKLDTNKIFKLFQRDIKASITTVLAQYNILPNSDLAKSVELLNNDKGWGLYINSYIKFIQSGRRRFAKKIPIKFILEFIRKRKITSSEGLTKNQLAFVLQNSIYQNGIKGKRGIMEKIEKVTLDIIIENVVKYIDVQVENQQIKFK